MKTIEETSSELRRIDIAGLGGARLWTASPAHAAIALSTSGVLEGLQAAPRASVSPDASPRGKAPLAEPLQSRPSAMLRKYGACQTERSYQREDSE
jgi:hypothetical protein